jgi:hypothetical protein
MPMARRRAPGKLLSDSLGVVLAKRPCRVIIDSTPAERLRAAGLDAVAPEQPALAARATNA